MKPAEENLAVIATLAEKLAYQAGELLIEERQKSRFDQHYKQGIELVTSADIAVDELIRAGILAHFPHHQILSEELAPQVDASLARSSVLWVIDPIDGTINFANGHPHVAISIGVAINGVTQVAVVYSPFLKECFKAIRGQGATLNGEGIAVKPPESLGKTVVATGFPYDKSQVPHLAGRLSTVLQQVQDIRRTGCASLDLCSVAAGRYGAYYEDVKPWDMAAGLLIAEEAGAKVGHFSERIDDWPASIDGRQVMAAPASVYQALFDVLQTTLERTAV
ncbi:inositol monophosphatase family protein [Pokkaliibacter sp. CJK22405]|uniref:inositol monophosphatase family protein n=1 Tax=Pokkaliibacter sp. CJK22405 TaxID=3384615 RepID=UPI003984F105